MFKFLVVQEYFAYVLEDILILRAAINQIAVAVYKNFKGRNCYDYIIHLQGLNGYKKGYTTRGGETVSHEK